MIFDYEKLFTFAEANAQKYQSAEPFSHMVIDEFISDTLSKALIDAFPKIEDRINHNEASEALDDGTVTQFGKRWLSMEMRVELVFRKLYWELNSAPFLLFLQKLTGIEDLIPDPYFAGGGLHEIQSGGYLFVHADYNKHPELNLDRRINLLLYLNKDWQESYGGSLELWDKDMSECKKKILPIENRCVVFSTTSDSFHGHPEPLTCPEGISRRSIALYYYTSGRPAEEGSEAHLTLWKKV